MKRRTLRAAVALADEAERRIRAAGVVAPPRADVLSALLPVASATAGAAKAAHRAALAHAEAARRADEVAESAAAAVASVVTGWLGSSPRPRMVDLDPARFRVELVRQDHAEAAP